MLSAAAMLACGPAANAHHSTAAYDRAHPKTLVGTVVEYHFMNPHVRIILLVPDGSGGARTWELEGGTVAVATREGLTPQSLRAGQTIRLLIAPRRDGADGGEWQHVLEIDGQPLKPHK